MATLTCNSATSLTSDILGFIGITDETALGTTCEAIQTAANRVTEEGAVVTCDGVDAGATPSGLSAMFDGDGSPSKWALLSQMGTGATDDDKTVLITRQDRPVGDIDTQCVVLNDTVLNDIAKKNPNFDKQDIADDLNGVNGSTDWGPNTLEFLQLASGLAGACPDDGSDPVVGILYDAASQSIMIPKEAAEYTSDDPVTISQLKAVAAASSARCGCKGLSGFTDLAPQLAKIDPSGTCPAPEVFLPDDITAAIYNADAGRSNNDPPNNDPGGWNPINKMLLDACPVAAQACLNDPTCKAKLSSASGIRDLVPSLSSANNDGTLDDVLTCVQDSNNWIAKAVNGNMDCSDMLKYVDGAATGWDAAGTPMPCINDANNDTLSGAATNLMLLAGGDGTTPQLPDPRSLTCANGQITHTNGSSTPDDFLCQWVLNPNNCSKVTQEGNPNLYELCSWFQLE